MTNNILKDQSTMRFLIFQNVFKFSIVKSHELHTHLTYIFIFKKNTES